MPDTQKYWSLDNKSEFICRKPLVKPSVSAGSPCRLIPSSLLCLLVCSRWVAGKEEQGRGGSQEGLQNTESFLLKTLHPKNKIPAETVIYISTK